MQTELVIRYYRMDSYLELLARGPTSARHVPHDGEWMLDWSAWRATSRLG